MHTRRQALAGIAALAALGGTGAASPRDAASGTLRAAAEAAGLFFGAAVTSEQVGAGDAYAALIREQCGVWTPEWELDWAAIEQTPGARTYAGAEAILAAARAGGQRVRGHTLVWHEQMPAWAEGLGTREDWTEHVVPYLTETSRRIGPSLFQWDVVNEAIQPEDGEPGGLRRTPFSRMRGASYIEEALALVHAQTPQTRLYINEYGLCYDARWQTLRRNALLDLVETLVARGAPLHGVGIQAHLDLRLRFAPRVLSDFLSALAATGVEITITELDVTEADTAASLDRRLARVAAEVRDVVGVALEQPALRGVVTWSLSDRYSWLRRIRKLTENHGLPYDDRLAPTPFRAALIDLFANVPQRPL